MDYDVVIIGGAFSGAATAQLIKRKCPQARVLIVEKNAEFDRKVGESTTEVSSCFLTRILGLANYLGHEQLAKQGLRLWFCKSPAQPFDDCVEIGPRYSARVPTFQVDREDGGRSSATPPLAGSQELAPPGAQEHSVRTRWVVDASGRATMLARK